MSGLEAGKKTDPKALAIVLLTIVLVAAAVGLRLWANDQRLRVPNLQAMASAPDGRVFIVLGDTLYAESAGGESLSVLPLSDWGVESFHGDLTVLEDGTVILARGRLGAVSAGEGVRLYTRQQPSADDPVEGLMRCDLESRECVALAGDASPAMFRRAFGIDADSANGLLYVSEPGRHRVVQMTLDGDVLAVSDDNWQFPNSVRVLGNGRVGFADTNHFRYVELEAGPSGFGDVAYEESVDGWPEIVVPLRVPSEVLKDSRGTLWMLVADGGMANAWLYRYPENGLPQRLALPQDADPVELAEIADRVLVTDMQHFRIHQFDLNGQLHEDFGSSTLKSHLAELRRTHAGYERIFDYSLAAVLLIALPALGAGLFLQRKSLRADEVEKESEVAASSEPLPEFRNLEAQFSRLHGEFIFWRKFTVLSTQESFRFGVLLAALFATLIGMLIHLEYVIAEEKGVPLTDVLTDGSLNVVFGLTVLGLMVCWFSAMFERLIITRDGIRYRSYFPGLLGHLMLFHRHWHLRWDQIHSLKLVHMGKGRNQLMWRYEIVAKDGRKQRIHPLSWRLAGEPETGIPLRDGLRQNPRMIREVIHRTLLFRLLGQQRQSHAANPAPEGA